VAQQAQNRVDLTYEISAGERARIERIVFVGNRAFNDWRLRDIITTGETNLFSFLRNNDVYDPDRVAVDQELLRRFYLRNGFADFRVVSANANFDRDRNAFTITFTLEEGEQYRIGRVDIESLVADVNAEALRRFVRAPTGSLFNGEAIDRSVEDMTVELSRAGRPFLVVRPRAERDAENRVVNVVYAVDEGSRLYVERINIRGNSRTMDQVIRREVDMAEGDAFNRVIVDRAERRLNNLNYFEPVRITREPGSAPDRVVLNVGIQEKPTGELNLGAGYSSTDGIIGDISVSERNFLGRGQFVRAAFGIGQFRQNVDFSFTEPYFLDRRLAAGFDVFFRRNLPSRNSPFRQELQGAGLRLGVELMEDVTLGLRYRAYEQRVQLPDSLWDCNIAPLNPNLTAAQRSAFPVCLQNGEASLALKSSVGRTFVSMPGLSLVVNKLDNNRDPRNGFYGEINLDVAGLGGDSRFVRTTADARYYVPVIDDTVVMLRAQAGNITGYGGRDVRLVDAFFRGGDFVRGFELSGIGPRDVSALNPSNDALGSRTYIGASAELQFNIPFLPESSGVRTALFIDAGTAYGVGSTGGLVRCGSAPGVTIAAGCFLDDSRIRASYGASLIWRSPLGPLRFDFAVPIARTWYDRVQFFRFSGGSTF
jgi:outer membrane protein insertion porin family